MVRTPDPFRLALLINNKLERQTKQSYQKLYKKTEHVHKLILL